MSSVYLSVVAASRNDDHDGTLLHRMKLFLTSLSSQLAGSSVETEIVLVEWNPPNGRPPLSKVLTVKQKNGLPKLRIISVPHHIHTKYKYSDKLGLFQFIAKNVGIRRARGEFILSTNIDILFSDSVIDELRSRKLNKQEMLRSVRYDVPDRIREDWSTKKILQWCKENTLRGYPPVDTRPQNNGVEIILERIGLIKRRPKLFTNACGDFTLLSRDNWHNVRAYPEFPAHGVKIDGLLCYNAHFAGAKERILPGRACIYHIDHPNSWSGEKGEDLQKRLTRLGIPFVTREEYVGYIDQMTRKNKPYEFNNERWGLADHSLPEYKT